MTDHDLQSDAPLVTFEAAAYWACVSVALACTVAVLFGIAGYLYVTWGG